MATIADKTLDCVGLFCPLPIVRMRDALRQMGPGQVLQVISDDPGAPADVERWAAHAGHELLTISREDTIVRFFLRKSG